MSQLSYGEIVTLLVPYEEPRTLKLDDAVFTVLQIEDRIKRIGATIIRGSGEQIGHAQMVKIYDRADFPRRPISTWDPRKLACRRYRTPCSRNALICGREAAGAARFQMPHLARAGLAELRQGCGAKSEVIYLGRVCLHSPVARQSRNRPNLF
jgi:hypothetical protein